MWTVGESDALLLDCAGNTQREEDQEQKSPKVCAGNFHIMDELQCSQFILLQ